MAADYPSGLTSKALMGQGQDNVSSTINQAGGINSAATTVTLTSGAAFPTSGYIQIDTETLKYTGKSSNDLTGLTRGLFGTAAAAHANNITVELTNSAGYIDELQEEVVALETKVGVDSSAVTTSLDFLAKSATARAYNSAVQSLTNGSFQKVTFNTKNWDIGGNFASSRFTAPVAGYYQVNAAVHADQATDLKMIAIYINGAKVSEGASSIRNAHVSDVVNLAATDYVEIYVYPLTANQDTTGGTGQTWMSIALIKL